MNSKTQEKIKQKRKARADKLFFDLAAVSERSSGVIDLKSLSEPQRLQISSVAKAINPQETHFFRMSFFWKVLNFRLVSACECRIYFTLTEEILKQFFSRSFIYQSEFKKRPARQRAENRQKPADDQRADDSDVKQTDKNIF